MVKLTEGRGKELFRKYGIPVPNGLTVTSPEDAEQAVRTGKVPCPCVVKAQVLAGGRGKGGAVRFASTPEEARAAAAAILGSVFQGETVREVLLEEKVSIARELYVSFALDRARRLPVLMTSARGGVEIESVGDTEIDRQPVEPFPGLAAYERRRAAVVLGLRGPLATELDRFLVGLYRLFDREDAELAEVNPLAVVGDRLLALDAKVIIEDDAVFRHPEFAAIRDDRTPLEELAREKEIAFVQLDGDIGVIANGAGLTMATLDVLKEFGGAPGVFLDLGGTDDPKKVTEAFLLMAQAKPRAVFLNIFGGVTRCDTVASGLVTALASVPPADRFPLVARIRGHNEAEGIAILRAAGVTSVPDLRASAQAVVAAAKEGR
jgi:succinyl-CoA synthetase beta subunit